MPISARRVPLGSRMPWFDLVDLTGRRWTSNDLAPDRPALLVAACSHSPYVRHIETRLGVRLAEFASRGVSVIVFAPNDEVAYPTDDAEHLGRQSRRMNLSVPYCLDSGQRLAKALGAACTPEFFLFDVPTGHLIYHGQFDSSRPSNSVPVSGVDISVAVDQALNHDVVDPNQELSFGCSIKWSNGRAPQYLSALDL